MTAEAVGAHALETVHTVHASATVVARTRAALIDIHRAILSRKTRPTCALIVVVQVRASTTVGAGFGQAQIHFVRTQRAKETGHTLTSKFIDQIDTSTTVLARIALAVVDIVFAQGSAETTGALAFGRAISCHQTGTLVVARIGGASVHINVAHISAVAVGALALKAFGRVAARAVHAGLISAGYNFVFAQATRPALLTVTFVAAFGSFFNTTAGILAGVFFGTGINFVLTVGSIETGRTHAGEQTLAGIETGATILTRTMICAVVQVLVAKQTAPAFVANAFPGFGACAVHTAGVSFTFVAQWAFVTGLTSKTIKKDRGKLIFLYRH